MKVKREERMVVSGSDVPAADGLTHDNELKTILIKNV